jgi:2-amino-4-hydroxy-6-hydroxymethyldihydropteridine diphosphokinase
LQLRLSEPQARNCIQKITWRLALTKISAGGHWIRWGATTDWIDRRRSHFACPDVLPSFFSPQGASTGLVVTCHKPRFRFIWKVSVDFSAMGHALVALGSNLGARTKQLSAALAELARLPSSRLIRRSGWFETPPIGGPAGQDPFLNGAALLWTALAPRQLLAELQGIEKKLGRKQGERWGARIVDLDLLLFDQLMIEDEGDVELSAELVVPHPRMTFRQFVLEPAAAVAPWMVHPTSGWTVQALYAQLTRGANVAAVTADDASEAATWVERLRRRFGLPNDGDATAPASDENFPSIVAWDAYRTGQDVHGPLRPKLILAFSESERPTAPAFHVGTHSRRMPNLPTGGPIAWIPSTDDAGQMFEAAAAIQAVWPALASVAPPLD